jgi:GNAT superfamily N-acetyltransferase
MPNSLEDMSRDGLIAAFEANKREAFGTFWLWPQAEAHSGPGLLWTVTSAQWAMINSVLLSRLEQRNVTEAIEGAIARGASRGVPILWQLGPNDTPEDLDRRLIAHGFAEVGDMPIMALDMSAATNLPPPTPGLVLEQVAGVAASEAWGDVTAACFHVPAEVLPDWGPFWERASRELGPGFIRVLARLDGEPVAASAVLVAGGVAGIYCVATVPDLRRRGIGRAVTRAACSEARQLGYHVAMLEASEMGVGLYEKIGFREVGKTRLFAWTP